MISSFCLSMIFSENRFPLFRIMLWAARHKRPAVDPPRCDVRPSFEGDGVHQAALAPGCVQAAIELQRARLAHVALEDFGVVTARLDGLHHPLVVEAKARSEFSGAAEQSLDRRYAGGFSHFVRIGRGHAEFFCLDEAVVKPGDDVGPHLVAIARERPERFLADRQRQDEVVGSVRRRRRNRTGERGGVLGHGVTTPAEKRLIHGVNAIEHQRFPFDPVGATVIAERHLMGRSLRDANGGAIQPLQILHAAVAPDHKTLAVIEIDRPLPQPEGYAAQKSLRRIAIEHVDLARLQRGEPVLRRECDITYLIGVTENPRCQRTAVVDVESLVIALGVWSGESGKARADAAHQRAALLDRVERSGGCSRKPCGEQSCSNDDSLHSCPPPMPTVFNALSTAEPSLSTIMSMWSDVAM